MAHVRSGEPTPQSSPRRPALTQVATIGYACPRGSEIKVLRTPSGVLVNVGPAYLSLVELDAQELLEALAGALEISTPPTAG